MASSKSKRVGSHGKRSVPRRSQELQEAVSWWDRLPVGRQHLIAGLLLLILGALFYAPVTFGDRELAGGDIVRWRAMAESALAHERATGETPLWVPNPFGGMPAYMITYPLQIPQFDSVARLVRHVFWPTFQFWILVFGVYALTWTLTRRSLAALLAATAFGFTTYIPVILVAGHASKFITLSWTPWLLLAFVHVLRKPTLLAGLFFAAVAAVNLRAGHPQITYHATFLAGIWWIVEGVGALREKRLKPFALSTGILLAGALLAVLMVAHPYWPQAEYKAFTIRGSAEGGEMASGLDWTYAMGWSQGWSEMLTLLIAGALGEGSRTGLYWGPKIFTEGPHYVGGIVVLFALLALWTVRTRTVAALGIGAAVLTLFALGEHASFINEPMFAAFPLFDAFRGPEIWLHMVEMALAVLAGIGLAALLERATPAYRKKAVYTAGGLLVAVVLLFGARTSLFSFEKPGEVDQLAQQVAQMQQRSPEDPEVRTLAAQAARQYREERADLFAQDARRTLIVLAIATGGILLILLGKAPVWMVALILIGASTVDLWTVGKRHFDLISLPRADAEGQIETFPYDEFIKERVAEAGGPGHFRSLALTASVTGNARPAYHYETISGYHGAKLRLFQDYLDQILVDPATGRLTENGLDLMSLRYVAARGMLPGSRVVFEDTQSGLVVLDREFVPRAYLVGEVEVVADPEAAWARLRDPSFDPRRAAVLRSEPAFELASVDSASVAEVELLSFEPDEIVWSVKTDGPRLLVAHEVYYPAGWKAEVSGLEVPIERVNYFLRGVPIPEGEHTVRMTFEPARHGVGLWIAGGSTALVYLSILLLLGFGWISRNRNLQTD